jgi:hypothetical protein
MIDVEVTHIKFKGDASAAQELLRNVGQLLGSVALPALHAVHVPATLDTTQELPLCAAEQEAVDDAFPVRLPGTVSGARKKKAARKVAQRVATRVTSPASSEDDVALSPQDELAEQIADIIRLDGPQTVPQLAVRLQKHSIAIGKCVTKYSGMLERGDDKLIRVV